MPMPCFGGVVCCGRRRESDSVKILREPWTNPLAKAFRTLRTVTLGAKMFIASRKLRRRLKKRKDLDEDEEQEQWDELHRNNAKLVLAHVYRYRGFFSKLGQSMSAKKGLLPAPWVETLEPLQNEMPFSKFRKIEKVIRRDLRRPLHEVFSKFEEQPVASASIAQAHLAHIRESGEKVCVKVQHGGVAELMNTDLTTIGFLVRVMKKFDSDAPDLTEIVKEYRRTAKEEVNFLLEAENAMQACNALRSRGFSASSCEPLMQYCSRRVLTMRFVEGWKMTDAHRFPPGSNREDVARQLVEAFAMLVFEEGLIHGDPHPGNVFVQPVAQGSTALRPVFLDWGIVRRLEPDQRVALAKIVVSSLSRDRALFAASLRELGFELGGDVSSKKFDLFMMRIKLAMSDTIPSSSLKQFVQQRQKIESETQARAKADAKESGAKEESNPIAKFAGPALYFLRGLQLVRDCCGNLEVIVPVAKVLLKYAFPLLERKSENVERPLARSERSNLELAVLGKLQELKNSGLILGAQVAVLCGDAEADSEKWLCDAAFGKTSPFAGTVSETTLMPLLGTGSGVLIACLLSALARPTVSGRTVGLDGLVEELWPEFSRRGKGGTTISQVLQQRAGLSKPFPRKCRCKTFCDERKMEEYVSSCPPEGPGVAGTSPVVGVAAAALLRRATGHSSGAEALRAILTPLGLEDEILYHGDLSRMAHVGHKLVEEVPMSSLWEMLEQREQDGCSHKSLPQWLTWAELSDEDPWCADPLLMNTENLQSGKACATGRGLRATARALCRLYGASSDFVPPDLLERARTPSGRLQVASREEWDDLGGCMEISSAGWQLFRFQRHDGEADVVGHGHMDGATGSIAFRIPGVSVAVLLNCVDKEAPQAGLEILKLVTSHLGLEPRWHHDQPPVDLPIQKAAGSEEAGSEDISACVRRLESQVIRLTEALDAMASRDGIVASGQPAVLGHPLNGQWISTEVTGLDELLEALNVPVLVRSIARRMQRAVRFEEQGGRVKIVTTTTVARRRIEHSECAFRVGEPFEGQMGMSGTYQGSARWATGESSGPLVVEKRFSVRGRNVLLEETYNMSTDGLLLIETCIKGRPGVELNITSMEEKDLLCRSLDCRNLRLKEDINLGGESVFRGGHVVGAGHASAAVASVAELAALAVPAKVRLQYEDLHSTMHFRPEGGRPRAGLPAPVSCTSSSAASVASFYSNLPVGRHMSSTTPAILEGVVWKRSRHLHRWRRRVLVLSQEGLRCVKETGQVTEMILATTMRDVCSADDVLPNCLRVDAGRRGYYFAFSDIATRDKWHSEVSHLVNGMSQRSM